MTEKTTTRQRIKRELTRDAIQFTIFGIGAKIADDNQQVGEGGYWGEGYVSDVIGATAEASVVSAFLTGSKPWVRRIIPPASAFGKNILFEIQQKGLENKVFDVADFAAYGVGGVLFVAADVALEKIQKRRAKKKAAKIALSTQ